MYEYRKPKGLPQPILRMCQTCGVEKNARDDFYWAKQGAKEWPQSHCKKCAYERTVKYRSTRKKMYAKLALEWRKKNPEKAKEIDRKSNAKRSPGPRCYKVWKSDEIKVCPICHEPKIALSDFFLDRSGKHPIPMRRCKACYTQWTGAWKKKNPEKCSVHGKKSYHKTGLERKRRFRKTPEGSKRHVFYTQQRKYRVENASAPDSKSLTPEWFRSLCNEYGDRCIYCHQPKKLSMDHVLPITRGGLHTASNIVPACGPCNSSKKNRTMLEWKPEFIFPLSVAM